MIPQQFKQMFGLKDEKDLKMANNIWKMLDEMSSNDPQAYEKFIEKNLTQGLTDAKVQKQKKQKPYKILPQQYMLLQMQAQLQEQYLSKESQPEFKEKLDININKQKWTDVKAKFPQRIHIFLNICHTDRIKNPTSKSKNGQQIKQFNISMIKDIQNLYYSLQGPIFDESPKQQKPNWYFCMIFNTQFLKSFQSVPNGVRILLGIAVSYFQQRIKSDRNPVLMKVNTHALYAKNLFYGIQKNTIAVSSGKKFKYGKDEKICQFLLERDIDIKQRPKKQLPKTQPSLQQKQKGKKQILLHPKQPEVSPQLPSLVPKAPEKKFLIQVLDQKQTQQQKPNQNIPYSMKETEDGYIFEFLIAGVETINDLDLEVSDSAIRIKTLPKEGKSQRKAEIRLEKKVDENLVKAKMKKKAHTLQVTLTFKK